MHFLIILYINLMVLKLCFSYPTLKHKRYNFNSEVRISGQSNHRMTRWSINKKKSKWRGAVSVQLKWGIQILGIHMWIIQVECICKHLVVFISDTSFEPEIKSWVPRKALASQLCPVDIGLSFGSINQHTPSYCNLCLPTPQICVWPNRITFIKIIMLKLSAKFHEAIPCTVFS